MDNNLEFSSLKECIKPFVASVSGQLALDELGPLPSWTDVKSRWNLLSEMMSLVETGDSLHFAAVPDLSFLTNLRQGSVMDGQDIFSVSDSLRIVGRVKKALIETTYLSAAAEDIDPLPELVSDIEFCIMPTGEVSDVANRSLRELKSRYRSLRSKIIKRMESILGTLGTSVRDEIITTRNNRYVLSLRLDYGTRIKGITHDYSRTKQTAYVEPLELVEDNNLFNQLRSDINEEEIRILRELTSDIHASSDVLRRNLEIYGLLDLVHASAGWAVKTHSVIPELSSSVIRLEKARHPLLIDRLGMDATVPLDIRLDTDCLIITGPNAGGKTVALKTLGLLVTMARCGLPVPVAQDSQIPPFTNVWVDMDTNQDIDKDLSSFTAHAVSVKKIYQSVKPGDLVLLDEPGTGTDHEQGGAFAVSCIDGLRRKGAVVVVTSHSDLVKLYGLSTKGVVNAAACFDERGPLFKLEYGIIGSSRAIDILESIGFPEELIQGANDIVAKNEHSPLARAIDEMSKIGSMREEAAAELEEARLLRKKAAEQETLARKETALNALKFNRLIGELEKLSTRPVQPSEIKRIRQTPEARELSTAITREQTKALDINEGSVVRIRGGKAQGKVIEIKDHEALVLCGNKRLSLAIDMIEAVEGPKAVKKSPHRFTDASAEYVMPVVVAGMRVDEAMPVVEKALDCALLSGQKSLEIIHGAGTGTLRKAIRKYLEGMGQIKGFDGQETKTVIHLS